jgi:hypothetical protein
MNWSIILPIPPTKKKVGIATPTAKTTPTPTRRALRVVIATMMQKKWMWNKRTSKKLQNRNYNHPLFL